MALDAHLVVFIARMRDVDSFELIPQRLAQYADTAMESAEWKQVMGGRRTMMAKPPE